MGCFIAKFGLNFSKSKAATFVAKAKWPLFRGGRYSEV